MVADLTRLLAPGSVAVVGATDRPGSYGGETLRNLLRAGYQGRLVGVHPTRREVLGVRCVPSLADVGSAVDAVVVATPAASVAGVVTTAADLGCGGVVVYAAGFAEVGRADLQTEVVSAARGMPLVGPNANGLVSVGARAPLWGDAVTLAPRPGRVALVTQSGNVGVVALAHRGGDLWHSVTSLGNAAVVDAPTVVAQLAATGEVRVVAMYLEADGDGAALADAFAVCAENDVRVVVLKAGRSAEGRAAGAAHTAALAGDQRVFAALVHEAGGVLVREPHDLFETARAMSVLRRDPRGLAALSSSGGDAAMVADLAADEGVPFAAPSAGTVDALRALLPPTATVGNPLDHTNHVWADTEAVAAITAALAADPGVGHVMYVQDEPSGLDPGGAREWALTRRGAVVGAQRVGLYALLVATTPGQEPAGAVGGLRAALAAVAAMRRPAPSAARLRAVAAATRRCDVAAATRRRGGPDPRLPLAEHEAKRMLADAGVQVPVGAVVHDVAAASQAAAAIGLPVVLKLSATDLLHKSDVGALEVGVATLDAVSLGATRLLAMCSRYPSAALLVERMAGPGTEVVVAARADGVVPCLVVGLGGVWAEALDDVVVLPLPVDAEQVERELSGLRGAALLLGGRGRPALAVGALAQAAVAVAGLLVEHRLTLVELNPVLIDGSAAVAVDAVVR